MGQLVRGVIGALGATRYLVSIITASLFLLYEVVGLSGSIPRLPEVAVLLDIPPVLFGIVLYLTVGLIVGVLWSQSRSIRAQIVWRPIYRQTDRSGLLLFDGLLLLILFGGVLLALGLFADQPEVRSFIVFLAVILGAPLLLDFVPTQRPRRIVVPGGGQTMREIATNLSPDPSRIDDIIRLLEHYNELRATASAYHERPDERLPEGFVIEVPPFL